MGLAAFGGSLYFARSRTDATFRLGITLAVVGAVVLLALLLGAFVLDQAVQNPANGPAAVAIWWAFVDSLQVSMRLAVVVGVALAAGAGWIRNKGWPGRVKRAAGTGSQGTTASPIRKA
jgi:hypothetical protein